jgi:hypothetical protein
MIEVQDRGVQEKGRLPIVDIAEIIAGTKPERI